MLLPHQKSSQNFKLMFPVILQIFDVECHGQTYAKVSFVMFALIKWKSLYWENKKYDLRKTQVFSLF